MTTPPIMTINDELLAELEAECETRVTIEIGRQAMRALLQHVRELKADAERLDFLQEQTKAKDNQRFGISLQWLPKCEGEPSGYRYMHRKFATDQHKALREAIDAAMIIDHEK